MSSLLLMEVAPCCIQPHPSGGFFIFLSGVQVLLMAPFKNVRFDTKYQAFFCAFIGVRVSYVLDIINKDSSNNDIFYNECVLVIVLFAKRF